MESVLFIFASHPVVLFVVISMTWIDLKYECVARACASFLILFST